MDAEGKPPESASVKAFTYETTNGKNAVDAASRVPTLERFIYSALTSFSKSSNGKYTRSMHAEARGQIVEYIETEQPELAKKTSLIYVGVYSSNRLFSPPFDPNSGKYIFTMALKKDFRLPIINPRESIGPFVRALVEDEAPGIHLLAYNSYLTMGEVVDTWSKASGKEGIYVPITTKELHEKMGRPYEVLDGLDAANEFGYTGANAVIEPHQLKSKVHTKSFEDWLKEKDWDKELSI